MFNKIIQSIKSIFGLKQKNIPAPVETVQTEQKKQARQPRQNYRDRNPQNPHTPREPRQPREQRKKETPEEYRLRHEAKAKERKQRTGTAEQPETELHALVPYRQAEPHVWDSQSYKVPVEDGKTRFSDLPIRPEVMHAIADLNFQYCTPVQAESLPQSLSGEDVAAEAQTGTGKTAAFLISIFTHILNKPLVDGQRKGTPRALILAPTRELVLQIEKDARSLGKYVPCTILSLLGGIGYNTQMSVLKSEALDILICTPGRLIDFLNKKLVDLHKVEILVIDEADRMLDMGFLPSVKKIVFSTPQKSKRQTMFFTATMSSDVMRLADSWTKQAYTVKVVPEEITVPSIEQITYITTVEEKRTLLYNLIMQKNLERVLIFVNRREDARRLKATFDKYDVSCALLSGDVEQTQRIKRLENFREGKVRILVATDVASRGIHVDNISHVINYNMPQDVEEYVHRIGRTGRAGASGISINFADEDSGYEMHKIQEYLGKKFECIFPEENLLTPIPEEHLIETEEEKPKREFRPRKNFNDRNRPRHNNNNRPRGPRGPRPPRPEGESKPQSEN